LIRQSAAMDTHYKTFADFKFTYDKSYDQQLLTAKDIRVELTSLISHNIPNLTYL
jgi:hypothetical protein